MKVLTTIDPRDVQHDVKRVDIMLDTGETLKLQQDTSGALTITALHDRLVVVPIFSNRVALEVRKDTP